MSSGTALHSLEITRTVAEWEARTGLAFLKSGTYVLPGSLSWLAIDCEAAHGAYWEPNVWIRHRW